MNKVINRKKSIIQISRLLIQIIFFIFLPSLYVQTLSGIKQIYLALIGQNIGADLLPQIIEVIAIIPITVLLGRFFCGWMCAFGSFTDFIYHISNKIFKKKVKISEKADRLLKYIKYIVLLILITAVWSFNVTIFKTANPWDTFGMLVTIGNMPNLSYVLSNLLIGFIIFMGIIMISVFIERFFCRYLCPMGAVFALVSKFRIGKIRKNRDNCGKCRICTDNCAMGIPLYQTDVVDSMECINCMKCITACPRKNTTYEIAKSDVRPLIASAASVAIITGSYYSADLLIGNVSANSVQTSIQTEQTLSSTYKDGTYEGTGTGFKGGTTKVYVTIKNGAITQISTISYRDDKPYYEKAFNTLSNTIKKSQSADVDTVSGATFSSKGIMAAVDDALNQAKVSNASLLETTSASTVSSSDATAPSGTTQPSEPQSTTTAQSTVVSSSQKYKDGTYQGSGTGFRGATTKVTVVVEGGKIASINANSYGDDKRYFERAFSMITKKIVSKQSADVDTVSGATFSSNGIMSAVDDALTNADL